jgi:UDP-N-acetylglucosamine--N-acetylmuramyl-(pentapeptide) pyrophosphoryl-undecaprenol N-acetylglucosamine transferase
MSAGKTIIFAGGGSGGHISPGLAIAERLCEQRDDVQPLFICSQREIDREMLEEAGERFVPIPATPPGIRPGVAWRFLRNFHHSKRRVRQLIREQNVACLVALGGFVAAPAVAAAKAERVPAMLINLDSPPGKANRWMARRCNRIVSAIPLKAHGFQSLSARTEVVGMPIRRRAIADEDAATCRRKLGLDPDRLTMMVTGASQGATSINRMMVELVKREPELFVDAQVLHLAGSGASGELRTAYDASGVQAVVIEFLHDIGLAWGAADVAISRAGANSVAEAAANRVPTIFLPYPYHRDMHQRNNAMPLVERGGALLLDDAIDPERNAQAIAPMLKGLLPDASRRTAMRGALSQFAETDAAETIAGIILDQLR